MNFLISNTMDEASLRLSFSSIHKQTRPLSINYSIKRGTPSSSSTRTVRHRQTVEKKAIEQTGKRKPHSEETALSMAVARTILCGVSYRIQSGQVKNKISAGKEWPI